MVNGSKATKQEINAAVVSNQKISSLNKNARFRFQTHISQLIRVQKNREIDILQI